MRLLHGPHINNMQNLSTSSLRQFFNTIQGTNSNNYISHVFLKLIHQGTRLLCKPK